MSTTPQKDPLRRIGAGCCGSVWAPSSTDISGNAVKRADGGPGRDLYNDFVMHQKVFAALSGLDPKSTAEVPRCHEYIAADDQFGTGLLERFPEPFQVPCNVLVTDRIPAFSAPVREKIIDKYCPERLRSATKTSDPDRDCIIRLYMGRRRRPARNSRFHGFNLRNYPLHADQVEELQLDQPLYARILAETLASLYWKANVDANDVEFVLAPPREESDQSRRIKSDFLGDHVVWLLDFDCCRDMPLDESGVEQAVAAFYRNDPYYPRPGQEDWTHFRGRFLEVSEAILSDGPTAHLPSLWVDLVERRAGGQ